MRNSRLTLVALLALVLVAAACTSSSGGGTSPTSPPAANAAQSLQGVCPNPVVVQQDWLPAVEDAALINTLGEGYQIDAKHKKVTGPLVDGGKPTGVNIEIRAGGPGVGYQTAEALMYQDPKITIGQTQSDELFQLSAKQPLVGVFATLDFDPQTLLWDPAQHPEWHIIADIGQTDEKVVYQEGATFMEYLLGSGILRRSQVDSSFDGTPSRFVASGGKIVTQGYATNDTWWYEHETKAWGKPVRAALVVDTGYPNYGKLLAVRADQKDKLAPCLKRLVPIFQRASVAFMADPSWVSKTTVAVTAAYKAGVVYSDGNAESAVGQIKKLAIIDNGANTPSTLGDFDMGRLGKLLGIVGPIFAARKQPVKPGLTAEQAFTNEYIDPKVGLGQ
jgi:hypothetical protein